MSSVARHGKDGQELKLKTIGPTFFYFRGMPTIACVQTLPSLQKKIGERGPLSPLIFVWVKTLRNDFKHRIDLKQQYPCDIAPLMETSK